jgi:protein tyrosine/serine phosphatase
LYRSAQPYQAALENVIGQLGIRTVVNLRGPNPGEYWYDVERQTCEAMGVTLVDHAMSAHSLPSGELLGAVIDTLLNAEYPILIHCQGGADRTGAVSAIYRMLVLGHDRASALEALSPLKLHFREYAPCMDTLAEMYEPRPEWLAQYTATSDQIACQ